VQYAIFNVVEKQLMVSYKALGGKSWWWHEANIQ
jgi:hypothetical protein